MTEYKRKHTYIYKIQKERKNIKYKKKEKNIKYQKEKKILLK